MLRLIIYGVLLFLMFIPVIGFMIARLVDATPRDLIIFCSILTILSSICAFYKFGFLDRFLWDVSMPNLPQAEQQYINNIRSITDKHDDNMSLCEVGAVDSWIGKVEYSLFFGMKPAVAVRIDSHIVLRSSFMPKDESTSPAANQFGDLATGQMVHLSGVFPPSQGCPNGKSQWHMNENGDLEAVFEFSSIKVF